MRMTTREAFAKGTDTFNARDIEGFAEVLADDVMCEAPGGMRGEGKAACVEFYGGGWFRGFPDAHVNVRGLHILDDIAVEEGTFTGTQTGVLHSPTGDVPPTGHSVRLDYIQVLRIREGKEQECRSPGTQSDDEDGPVLAGGRPRIDRDRAERSSLLVGFGRRVLRVVEGGLISVPCASLHSQDGGRGGPLVFDGSQVLGACDGELGAAVARGRSWWAG